MSQQRKKKMVLKLKKYRTIELVHKDSNINVTFYEFTEQDRIEYQSLFNKIQYIINNGKKITEEFQSIKEMDEQKEVELKERLKKNERYFSDVSQSLIHFASDKIHSVKGIYVNDEEVDLKGYNNNQKLQLFSHILLGFDFCFLALIEYLKSVQEEFDVKKK